jgi:hypothetical protein
VRVVYEPVKQHAIGLPLFPHSPTDVVKSSVELKPSVLKRVSGTTRDVVLFEHEHTFANLRVWVEV